MVIMLGFFMENSSSCKIIFLFGTILIILKKTDAGEGEGLSMPFHTGRKIYLRPSTNTKVDQSE